MAATEWREYLVLYEPESFFCTEQLVDRAGHFCLLCIFLRDPSYAMCMIWFLAIFATSPIVSQMRRLCTRVHAARGFERQPLPAAHTIETGSRGALAVAALAVAAAVLGFARTDTQLPAQWR